MNILDNIVSWAPSILHFKGLGMRNLQYEIRTCQKSDNKVSKTVYVWSEFLWIRRYYQNSPFWRLVDFWNKFRPERLIEHDA